MLFRYRSLEDVQRDITDVERRIRENRENLDYLEWHGSRTRGAFETASLMFRRVWLIGKHRDLCDSRINLRAELEEAYASEREEAAEAEARAEERRKVEEGRDRERFRTAKERVGERYGLTLANVNTWNDLRRWEAFGRDLDRRYPDEWGHEEIIDLQVEHGILDRETVESWREQKRRRDELAQLQEDLHYVQNVCDDPDDLYTGPWAYRNDQLQAWVRRRPELERELDGLSAEAQAEDRELSDQDKEVIGALSDLRRAEAEARDARSTREDERRLEGPDEDDGLSLA